MSFNYQNPLAGVIENQYIGVSRDSTAGNTFSVLNVGGYMEVWTLNNLNYSQINSKGHISLAIQNMTDDTIRAIPEELFQISIKKDLQYFSQVPLKMLRIKIFFLGCRTNHYWMVVKYSSKI